MAEALLDSSGGRTNAGTDECCSSASIIATALTILTMVMLLTGYDDDDGTDDGADDGDACGDDRASRGFVLAAPPDFFCLPEARPGVESRPRDFDPEPDAVSRTYPNRLHVHSTSTSGVQVRSSQRQ